MARLVSRGTPTTREKSADKRTSKTRDAGLYRITSRSVESVDELGTPRDWVDDNLSKIVAAAEQWLKDPRATEAEAGLARDVLEHARNLETYRRDYVGRRIRGRRVDDLSPALWEMMALMLCFGMLDTNVAFGPAVRARAESNRNLKRANVTKAQALAMIVQTSTLDEAAEALGVSRRWLIDTTSKEERRSAMAQRVAADKSATDRLHKRARRPR